MAAATGRLGIFDEIDRISRTGVLGEARRIIIRNARGRIEHDIFQNAAEANSVIDLRLSLRRKANGLGVAASLEVEDAVLGPAVFIVADEPAEWIGRQRGLAGAGQAKEQG